MRKQIKILIYGHKSARQTMPKTAARWWHERVSSAEEENMRRYALYALVLPLFIPSAYADIILGSAGSFAVLAGSTVTNTGSTVLNGNLGVSPGTAITGFPPGLVNLPGAIHAGDAVAAQAQSDLTTAYDTLAGLTVNSNLTGQDLGGLTLLSGVYKFDDSAQLTGTLLLNAQGLANQFWVFQIGSTLTTASASAVDIINAGPNVGLFWQVGSSATLGTTTAFAGNIVAFTSITMNTGATISCGRALAQNGAVTLDSNTLDEDCSITAAGGGMSGYVADHGELAPVPEPSTPLLLATMLAGLALPLKWAQSKWRNHGA
jgi:hypothetical protein